jgi:hypothetical protein
VKHATILIAVGALLLAACGESSKIVATDEIPAAEDTTTTAEQTTTTVERTTTVPKPTTTTTAKPPKEGTKENPDPIGAAYEVTTGDETWGFKIDSVNFDGWPSIQAENQFNEPPPDGWRFVMLQLTLSYVDGPGQSHPGWIADVEATGSANRIYNEYSDLPNGESGCGVIPGDISYHDELMPGGSATGNFCLPIPDAEIADGSLRLLLKSKWSFGDDEAIWATPFA